MLTFRIETSATERGAVLDERDVIIECLRAEGYILSATICGDTVLMRSSDRPHPLDSHSATERLAEEILG